MITSPVLDALAGFIRTRLQAYFNSGKVIATSDETYLKVIRKWAAKEAALLGLEEEEQLIVLMALAPHVNPAFFSSLIAEFLPQGGDFPEFGGVRGANHRGILPTGETAQFVLAGNELSRRLAVQELFATGATFYRNRILSLEAPKEGEPRMSGRILLSNDIVEALTAGNISKPDFSFDFPARRITTEMEWSDLVVHPETAAHLENMKVWIEHNETALKDPVLHRKVKPGYRALFFGPPGTGKTLTASLLGKHFDMDVYRIDLSTVVSKYIGETEKNMERIFSAAEQKAWILFFDEADALFGKRSNVQSSHDKYANQEVSYLLQRVEDFPGLVILASNYKSNLDTAFIRRFNAIIPFPMPNAEERYHIWEKSMPATLGRDGDVDLKAIAKKYELSGSSIMNIVHFVTLRAISRQQPKIGAADIQEGIRRELEKEDKYTG